MATQWKSAEWKAIEWCLSNILALVKSALARYMCTCLLCWVGIVYMWRRGVRLLFLPQTAAFIQWRNYPNLWQLKLCSTTKKIHRIKTLLSNIFLSRQTKNNHGFAQNSSPTMGGFMLLMNIHDYVRAVVSIYRQTNHVTSEEIVYIQSTDAERIAWRCFTIYHNDREKIKINFEKVDMNLWWLKIPEQIKSTFCIFLQF